MVKPVKYYKKNGLVQQDLQIIPLFHCKMPVLLSTSLFIIQPHLPCEIESPFPLYSVRDKREPLLTSYHFSIVHVETMPACYMYHAFSCKTFKCHQICSYFKVNGGKLLEF